MSDQVHDERKAPFFWAHNQLVKDHLPAIGLHAFAVYMLLAYHADSARTCWPAIGTIARSLGVTKPTVRKALAALSDAGLISIKERATEKNGKKRYESNLYTLCPIPETGGKPDLPPKTGEVVNPVSQVVNVIDHVVKDVYPNKNQELESGNKTEETLPDGKVPTVATAPVAPEIPAKIAELYTTLAPLAEKSEEPPSSAAPPKPHPPGHYALVDGTLTGPFNNYSAARTFAPTSVITQTPSRDLVAVPPEKPGRKTKADKPKLEQPPADVKDAIAKLCYGGNEIIGANWARIVKTWNKLEKPDAAKVEKFSRWWYACHWIGQKKQPPKPEQMVSEWDVAMNWDGATAARANGYQTTTERNDEILKRSYERMMREKAAKEAKNGK